MNQKKIGGTKKKVTDALAMLLMIIVFCAFMFPFVMVIINSLKQKRDPDFGSKKKSRRRRKD